MANAILLSRKSQKSQLKEAANGRLIEEDAECSVYLSLRIIVTNNRSKNLFLPYMSYKEDYNCSHKGCFEATRRDEMCEQFELDFRLVIYEIRRASLF